MNSTEKPRYVLFICLLFLLVLSCQGTSAIPNLFATATPTATITPTSTSTPSPTPTATFTPTPLPTGMNADAQPNGATFVIDYDNKFQLSIPTGWIVVPLKGKDIAGALSELSKENPELKDMEEAFQSLNSDFIRLVALHKDPKYVVDDYATNLTIFVIDDKVMGSMPLDFVASVLGESLKRNGAKVVSKEPADNANNVMVSVIDVQQTTPTAAGKKVDIYNSSILFQSNEKLVMVMFSTPKQFKEDTPLLMEGVLDSIKPYFP